jgi:molecular chaperone GrpE (heat shock protein)
MKEESIIQTIEADIIDLNDRVLYVEKIMENLGKRIARQQEIIDILTRKAQACPYD